MQKNLLHVCMPLLFVLFLTACKDKKTNETEMEGQTAASAYNKTATMFCLSQFANVNYGMEASMTNLRSHLDSSVAYILNDNRIKKLVGAWKIVWGPVNYTYDTSSYPNACVSDNVMMVLQGMNPSTGKLMYVIAIAATNADSPYDWAEEDFQSASMVQWPSTSQLPNTGQFSNKAISDSTVTNTGKYISQGTATGLNVLYNIMKDPKRGVGLMDFLKGAVGSSTTATEVATTGHSLAAALGPSLALSLKDNQPYWNPSGTCTITSYATAGPSPGNMNWAAYFNSQVGSNFTGAYNQLDIVPHAFQYSMMQQLPGLYDSLVSPYSGKASNCFLGAVINCAAGNVRGFNYTSIFPPSSFFTNNFPINIDSMYQAGLSMWSNLSFSKKLALSAEINSNCGTGIRSDHAPYFAVAVCYGGIAALQHSTAYINLYGVQAANDIYLEYLAPQGDFGTWTFLWDMVGNPLLSGCVF